MRQIDTKFKTENAKKEGPCKVHKMGNLKQTFGVCKKWC
jgi:hypothetical protein